LLHQGAQVLIAVEADDNPAAAAGALDAHLRAERALQTLFDGGEVT
jgi:hypothetical protein